MPNRRSQAAQPERNLPAGSHRHRAAADLSGTLITVFPVTNETVFQSSLTMADEPSLKLETNKTLLPPEGSDVSLIVRIK